MNAPHDRFGRTRPRTGRQGLTLVELLVVISVVALLFGLMTTVVLRLLRAEAHTRNHPAQIHTLSQLADRFRQDVRGAETLSRLDDSSGSAWQIESTGAATINYVANPEKVTRTVFNGSDIASRNVYRLPARVSATLELFRVQDQPFARIRLKHADDSGPSFEAVAQVGRDQRFSHDTLPGETSR